MDNQGFPVHYPPCGRTLPSQTRTLPTQTRTLPTGAKHNLLIYKGFLAIFEPKSFKTYKNFFLKPFRSVGNAGPGCKAKAMSGRLRPGFQGAHSALPTPTARA